MPERARARKCCSLGWVEARAAVGQVELGVGWIDQHAAGGIAHIEARAALVARSGLAALLGLSGALAMLVGGGHILLVLARHLVGVGHAGAVGKRRGQGRIGLDRAGNLAWLGQRLAADRRNDAA